uniref:Uncharacterized protein n=1 Tax=Cacopsylla melanoneura TaxID=428564 RepID=A0A8D8ZDA6_9HEMI
MCKNVNHCKQTLKKSMTFLEFQAFLFSLRSRRSSPHSSLTSFLFSHSSLLTNLSSLSSPYSPLFTPILTSLLTPLFTPILTPQPHSSLYSHLTPLTIKLVKDIFLDLWRVSCSNVESANWY